MRRFRGRHAALGAGRAVAHRFASSSTSLLLAPFCRRGAGAAALLNNRRDFASGPHFDGFPFGAGFPGSPPQGNSERFYALLGVDKTASAAEIKQAYKKQAMEHHPDRGGDENVFKSITRAYEVLSNPEKKELYDAYGEEGLESMEKGGGGPQQGVDPFDLFGQIFGFNPGGSRSQQGRPVTPDSKYELQLSLEELFSGTTRQIAFSRDAICSSCKGAGGHDRRSCSRCDGTGRQVVMQQMGPFLHHVETTCSACRGRGYVIPAKSICSVCRGKCTVKEKKTFSIDVERGQQDGTEFRFRGQADEAPGHVAGDVVIILRQRPHPTFQRMGEALIMQKKVSLSEALCGFQLSVPFLDGRELSIRSAPGQVVRPGDVLVVQGRGMPRSDGAGDLFLLLDVDFPHSIDPQHQKQLTEILGGRPVEKEPEESSATRPEAATRVSAGQAQDLKKRWREARPRSSQEGQGNPGCMQQ